MLDAGGRSKGDGMFDEWWRNVLEGHTGPAIYRGQTMRARIAGTVMKAPESTVAR